LTFLENLENLECQQGRIYKLKGGHVIFSPAKRDFASDFQKIAVLKKRYDL